MNTNTRPKAELAMAPPAKVTKIIWTHTLDGKKPSELKLCWMRLGVGNDTTEVKWKRRLDNRGDYKNGCVVEYLKGDDLPPKNKKETHYCEFLFIPKYVYDEEAKKIIQNDEQEILSSKRFAIESLE